MINIEKDVTVVLVSYNSSGVIGECLSRLGAFADVVLVDNASTDDTIDVAKRVLPSVTVIANDENKGFGAAANQGFAVVKTPYGLHMNPDAVLDDGALALLFETLEENANCAMAAPLLVNPKDGDYELYVCGPNDNASHLVRDFRPSGAFCTWFVTGAVFLFRISAWKSVDGFDERYFLYHEDFDLCKRTIDGGYSIILVPEAVAHHLGGQSVTLTTKIQAMKDWHKIWSNLYFLSKHGDPEAARRLAKSIFFEKAMRTLLYVLFVRPKRIRGNYIKAHAAFTFLQGKPASYGPSAE